MYHRWNMRSFAENIFYLVCKLKCLQYVNKVIIWIVPFFYGNRNSKVNTSEPLSETDILSSGSDISDNGSSDLYQPSSSCNELTDDSSSPCSEDSDDEEIDRGAQNTESTTWGHCTLLPSRFGYVGAKEPQVNITESDPHAIYRNFLTDEILELFANETNRYTQRFISTHQLRRRSLMRKWKDTMLN